MNAIRSAAVAGVFYYSDLVRLAASVNNLLAQLPAATSQWPKAVVIEATLLKTSFGHLPSVWQRLPDPVQFVTQFRMKAGLTGDGWTDQSRVHLYQTEEIC